MAMSFEPKVLRELITLLRYVTKGLVFALYDNLEKPREVTAALRQALNGVLDLYELELTTEAPSLPARLRRLPSFKRRTVILVSGLDDLPLSLRQQVIAQLNPQREVLAELESPVVIWVTDGTLTEIVREAGDFFSWRSGVFDFRMPTVSLEILIGACEADGRYPLYLKQGLGWKKVGGFSMPFTEEQLATLRRGVVYYPPDAEGMRRLGGILFQSLFREEIGERYHELRATAQRLDVPLRIILQLEGDAGLATLPWELLYDREARIFLGASAETVLIRRAGEPKSVPVISASPLQILAIFPSPLDGPYLEPEAEWQAMQEALAEPLREGRIILERLWQPTMVSLANQLARQKYDILHFNGHSLYDDTKGEMLIFEDEDGSSRIVDAQALASLLTGKELRLVVLNSCQSAMVADALSRVGTSAVMAMTGSLSQKAALAFVKQFYAALAYGKPIDAAASEAQATMMLGEAEFAVPVLYLQATDGVLFRPQSSAYRPVHVPSVPNNLPPTPSPFVGREEEMIAVNQALASSRLVAVTGLGGIGKTALAIRLAHWHLEHRNFDGGIAWVSFEAVPLNPYGHFLDAVGEVLIGDGFRALDEHAKRKALFGYLGGHRCLLILDAFESVAEGEKEPLLHFLRQIAEPSAVLITSRERLPGWSEMSLGALDQRSSIELFVQVAQEAGISPGDIELEAAEEICRLLGGHPLAIRLAAPLAAHWPLERLHDEVERSIEVLRAPMEEMASGRHASLEASLSLSYEKLSIPARELFARLSVFLGGATVEAIQSVCEVENWRDSLDELTQCSLVDFDGMRVTMHSLVRQYAKAKLEKGGELDAYRRKAADFFLALARAGRVMLTTEDAAAGLNMFDAELANILASMDWCGAEEEWEKVVSYADALTRYLDLRGMWAECERRQMKAVEAARKLRNRQWEAMFLHNAGLMRQNWGDYEEARRLYQRSLEIKKELGDKAGIAKSLHQLGVLAQDQGDYQAARGFYQQSLEIAQALGDRAGVAKSLHQLGVLAQDQGDYAAARRFYQQSLEVFEELGAKREKSAVLHQLGILAQDQGDYQAAKGFYQQSLDIAEELGDQSGIASTLHQLGVLAQAQGDYEKARRLHQQSLEIAEELGDQSGIAVTLHQLAKIAQEQGDHAEAQRLYEESLEIAKRLGDQVGIAVTLGNLSLLQETLGNREEALKLVHQAEEIFQRLGSPYAKQARRYRERMEKRMITTEA